MTFDASSVVLELGSMIDVSGASGEIDVPVRGGARIAQERAGHTRQQWRLHFVKGRG